MLPAQDCFTNHSPCAAPGSVSTMSGLRLITCVAPPLLLCQSGESCIPTGGAGKQCFVSKCSSNCFWVQEGLVLLCNATSRMGSSWAWDALLAAIGKLSTIVRPKWPLPQSRHGHGWENDTQWLLHLCYSRQHIVYGAVDKPNAATFIMGQCAAEEATPFASKHLDALEIGPFVCALLRVQNQAPIRILGFATNLLIF